MSFMRMCVKVERFVKPYAATTFLSGSVSDWLWNEVCSMVGYQFSESTYGLKLESFDSDAFTRLSTVSSFVRFFLEFKKTVCNICSCLV